jgi:uncharacterized protein (DUF1697 family)
LTYPSSFSYNDLAVRDEHVANHAPVQGAATRHLAQVSNLHDVKYVALLRGINVGKNKRISMAPLREMLQNMGYVDVRTHLQSGNAVFRLPKVIADTKVEAAIHEAIQTTFGFDVAVLVRKGIELAEVVETCPYDDAEEQPTNVHAYFFDKNPSVTALKKAKELHRGPDEYTIADRMMYIHLENGLSNSSLTPQFWNAFGVVMTGRNWRTTTKLAELTADD